MVLASGVSYRRLDVPGLDRLSGAGVFYGAAVAEAPAMAGQEVFVVGAGNSAGQAALHLARHAAHVTILARGQSLAVSMSDYLVKEIGHTANLTVRLHTQVAAVHGAGQLEGLTLQDISGGPPAEVPAVALFILIGLIGAQPHTDWLADTLTRDDRGFVLTGRDLPRTPGPRTDGRWAAYRCCWNRACPGCSRPATCATGRSSGSRPPSATAPSPSSSSTSTSANSDTALDREELDREE